MAKRQKPSGRKKRNEHIYATTVATDATHLTVTVNALTGEVSFGGEMTNVYSEVNYDREKGPKILSRVPQAHSQISFDASPALQKNYDFLCAVDTNTKTVAGKTVSVVAAVILRRQGLPLRSGLESGWRCEVPFCIEYVGLTVDKPENFGWLAALETLARRGFVKVGQRVGIIVDSDLGNLRAYNERTLAVDSGQLLPTGVQLIYATADSGKENVVNFALGIADSAASQCLTALETGRVPFNDVVLDNPLFERMRSIGIDVREDG